MKRVDGMCVAVLSLVAAATAIAGLSAQQPIPHPRDVFGFELGADYKLAKYAQIEGYFERLDAASDRVKLVQIGESVLGRSLLLALISSEENIRELERYREISERLARGRDLSDEAARQLAKEGKAIVWIDAGIHATEVAPVQSTPLLAYRVVTEDTEEMQRIRDDVILLLMPVMNPDGMDMVADWYESNLGTPYETAPLPGLYHFYTGHDNNRDWAMHTQKESQAVAPILYEEWYPQILYIQHQTGPFPARIHMPPFDDPVNPNIHPLVVQSVNVIGTHMAKRFGEERKPGAIQHRQYPMWRADGLRYAVYGHNIMGVHTETQLHRYATPRYYDPDSLPRVFGGRGAPLSTTDPSVFYPDPWRGGWWRLGDAVEYVLTACMGVLDIADRLKEDWLYNSYTMARDAVEKEGDVFAWVIPSEQWDRSEAIELVRILRRAGVEVHRATAPFSIGAKEYAAGSYLAYGGQAFRGFIAHVLDKQVYPDRRLYSGGPPIPPYDLAGWTFPIAMGVRVDRVEQRFAAQAEVIDEVDTPVGHVSSEASYGYALSHQDNLSALAVNRLLAAGDEVSWSGEAFQAGGRTHSAGTIIVGQRSGTAQRVEELARELGLDFVGLDQRPAAVLYRLHSPRVGLYKSWVANMDEGWTRWILTEEYDFAVDTLHDGDVRTADLSDYDAIVLPDQNSRAILDGHAPGTMPPEYVGGMGADGAAMLKKYVEDGGTLVALDNATGFAIELLELPVRNVLRGLATNEFFVPGSLVRLNVDNTHPLAYGMPTEAAAMFRRSKAFALVHPADEESSRVSPRPVEVVARYGRSELLLSGFEIGAERHLADMPAVVRIEVGDGDVVLIGFRPQFRAIPRVTFKLLFNAIHGATARLPRARGSTHEQP
jgi:hypothetical protein